MAVFQIIVLIVTPCFIHYLGVHFFCLLDLISQIMDFSNVGKVLIAGTGQVCPSTDDRFIDRTQMDWPWFIDLTAASLARLVFRCYTSLGVFSFFSFVFSSFFFSQFLSSFSTLILSAAGSQSSCRCASARGMKSETCFFLRSLQRKGLVRGIASRDGVSVHLLNENRTRLI